MFVERRRHLGITVRFDDHGQGAHDWPYWQRELHRSLPLLLDALHRPPRVCNPGTSRAPRWLRSIGDSDLRRSAEMGDSWPLSILSGYEMLQVHIGPVQAGDAAGQGR